ncbi:MAG: hypothetical protein MZV64_35740 [Ignavibacteriales bacterium]|nr:hypothetical protein [Ignavibacteriales bacterium]
MVLHANAADKESNLKVVEVIRAGKALRLIPGRGECAKIMTGAIVPDGCDFVFPVEDSVDISGGFVKFTGIMTKANISWRAEDLKAGEMVLEKIQVSESPGYCRSGLCR